MWVIWQRRKGVGGVQAELSEQCLGAGLTAMGEPAPTPHDRPSRKRGGLRRLTAVGLERRHPWAWV